jgi:hypothetical protein
MTNTFARETRFAKSLSGDLSENAAEANVARSTLANSFNPHQLFAAVRSFTPPSYPQPQSAFRVFPTGEAEYHWHIVALATNQTVSRHKSLSFALRKCTQLNEQRTEGAKNETN